MDGLKLLILEDRVSDAELMVAQLTAEGLDAEWTRVDSEETFRAALAPAPDIVLADYTLPQFDAVRALMILHDLQLDVPLIVVTGTVSEEAAVRCIKLGAADYLLKDRLARLGGAVHGALEQQRLREDQRRAREELREREDRFRSLVQSIDDLVFTFDAQQRCTGVHGRFLDAEGLAPERFLGQTPRQVFADEARELHERAGDRALAGEHVVYEWSFEQARAVRYFQTSLSPLRDEHGTVTGAVGVGRETTAQRRAEARVQFAYEETISRLAMAAEFRSLEIGAHIDRIGDLCDAIAAALGLDDHHRALVRTASPMHDVGKIGIPDRVLLKPGRLTPAEHREMERHTEIGHLMLSGSDAEVLELAAAIAWTHHERIDGTGYPRELRGEQIPLEGRIVAVSDVFDALTSDRVYRAALSVDDAIETMCEGRGSHFDPEILDVFLEEIAGVAATRGAQ